MASTPEVSEPVRALLGCYFHNSDETLTEVPQFEYRRRLVSSEVWGIQPGMNILEIGCGQGECTLALAQAVGPSGSVTAIDPAPADYGEPTTLGESQEHILNSLLGGNIRFLQADAQTLVASSDKAELAKLDAAVLCHSLWYFPSAESVQDLFSTLAWAGIPRIFVAEWHAVLPDGPRAEVISAHYYAAMIQRRLHELAPQGERGQNVRSALSKNEILELAGRSGWKVEKTGTLEMDPGMQDGWWEVAWVSSDTFEANLEAIEDEQEKERLKEVLRREVESRVNIREKHRCMDSFWAVLSVEPTL